MQRVRGDEQQGTNVERPAAARALPRFARGSDHEITANCRVPDERRANVFGEPTVIADAAVSAPMIAACRQEPQVAQTIGRFELIRELGRGGMGRVFLGRDTKLGRKVAIKFLLQSDASFVQRFLVEARATARCTHENIVTIYEFGEHEGQPYLVLEYLEGRTLGKVFDGELSLRELVEIMTAIARALARAHEHGIVHRDLKPANVIVTERGHVKVLDFGIAQFAEAAAAGPAQTVLGTVPYMPPEQWRGEPVDHQADIWAFGLMWWRAFARVHPAGPTSIEKIGPRLRDLDTPLPSLATRVPECPPELVEIVDRCLAMRKSRRFATAAEVVAALEEFLAPTIELSTDELSPYQGLTAFGEDAARYFFGRTAEIRAAVRTLEASPLLAVVGPSGVGKSSFVHAGVVPALRAHGYTHVHVIRPGRTPLARLAAVAGDVVATGETTIDIARIEDAPGLFGTLLRNAASRRGERVVLVVDQLEELFTLCDSPTIRTQFLTALLSAADDPSSPVRVVLSMRADFLDRLDGHKTFLAELSRGLMFLSAPDPTSVREVIVRPAELAGYTFEDPWIVDDMLEAATARGALPLVSFAATQMWETRDRSRRVLSVAAYNAMGGVWGAVTRHADRVVAAVPPSDHKVLRAIMLRLVTPEGTRAVVDLAELTTLTADARVVSRIVDLLVNARLIHLHGDGDGSTTIELVHETLITEWPTLRNWLDEGPALRAFLPELRHAAKQWASRGRTDELVWRGAIARDALERAMPHLPELVDVERDFVRAVQRQQGRARRRRIAILSALICACVLVLAGASTAMVQIKLAERNARDKAVTAETALREAKSARDALQDKLDVIDQERAAREAAERERIAAEDLRRGAQEVADAARLSEEESREQLKQANIELERRVREAEAARERALLAQAAAYRAGAVANEARAVAERLLAKERAEREKLEQRLRDIGTKL